MDKKTNGTISNMSIADCFVSIRIRHQAFEEVGMHVLQACFCWLVLWWMGNCLRCGAVVLVV